MTARSDDLLTVDEAKERLGVSTSTVWRLIRRGSLRSVRRKGRRLIPRDGLDGLTARTQESEVAPFTAEHPIFRLVGAGRSGGRGPGARDKHAALDA